MTFGISKGDTLFVKPKNFIPSNHHENPIFKIGMYHLPSPNHYTYHGIPFNKSLDFEPITANMNCKINYTVNFILDF